MAERNLNDPETVLVDIDPDIGVARDTEGNEIRLWEHRSVATIRGSVAVKNCGIVIPYSGTESAKDIPAQISPSTSFLIDLPG
jgi:hypothetical protein